MSLKQNLFYLTLIFLTYGAGFEWGKLETFTDQEQAWVCPAGGLPNLQSPGLQGLRLSHCSVQDSAPVSALH